MFTAQGVPHREEARRGGEVGAPAIAHGSTGKGNDQVRFDVTTASIAPDLTVVAPVRDWNMSRPEETDAPRSTASPSSSPRSPPTAWTRNLFGRFHRGRPAGGPDHEPTEDVFTLTTAPEDAPNEPGTSRSAFVEGLPTSLNGEELPLVELIVELNRVAGAHGVGRIDMIEDRLVGIKSREIYECPAALAIIQAHKELETMTLTKDVLRFKATVEQRYAESITTALVHALKRAPRRLRNGDAKTVSGSVRSSTEDGIVTGRTAPQALYSKGSYLRPEQHLRRGRCRRYIALWGLPAR